MTRGKEKDKEQGKRERVTTGRKGKVKDKVKDKMKDKGQDEWQWTRARAKDKI